jgi:hypothetical protein
MKVRIAVLARGSTPLATLRAFITPLGHEAKSAAEIGRYRAPVMTTCSPPQSPFDFFALRRVGEYRDECDQTGNN